MTGTRTRTKTITRSFIGCKIINAVPMDVHNFEIKHDKKVHSKQPHIEFVPGYEVTYPDGYVSWSPKDVFENAYREITVSERKLLS